MALRLRVGLNNVIPGSGSLVFNGFAPTFASVPPGGAPLSFFQDWRTATGNGDAALRDGTKADEYSGPSQALMNIINNPGTKGFPSDMAHLFDSIFANSDDGQIKWTAASGVHWSAPNIGARIHYRIFLNVDFDDGANLGQCHPFQTHDLAWELKIGTPAGGVSQVVLVTDISGSIAPNDKFRLFLPTKTCWRLEMGIDRVDATHGRFAYFNIYAGNATSPTYTAADWACTDAAGTLASNNPTFPMPSTATWVTFDLGNNDIGSTTSPTSHMYWGGWAVDHSNPCGPYSLARG